MLRLSILGPLLAVIADYLLKLCNDNEYNVYGVYHPKNSLDILSSIPEFVFFERK